MQDGIHRGDQRSDEILSTRVSHHELAVSSEVNSGGYNTNTRKYGGTGNAMQLSLILEGSFLPFPLVGCH